MKYPIRTAVEKYLEKRAIEVGESTLANERRMLNNLAKDTKDGSVKNLTSRNPYKMQRMDVRAIIDHLRARELENETLEKYLRYMNGLLIHYGNHALENLKSEAPKLFPKRVTKPIHYLKEDLVKILIESARKMEVGMAQ